MCTSPPSDTDYPTFAEIIRIFVPDDTKQLLVRSYYTETYSSHFNAYQVVKTYQFSVVSVSKLSIHEAYHKYFISPNLYVMIISYHHVEYDI